MLGLAIVTMHKGKATARPHGSDTHWIIANIDTVVPMPQPGDPVLVEYEPADQFCRIVPLTRIIVMPAGAAF